MKKFSNFKNSDKFWSALLAIILIILFIIKFKLMVVLLGIIVSLYGLVSIFFFESNNPYDSNDHVFGKLNLCYIFIYNLKKFNNWLNSL